MADTGEKYGKLISSISRLRSAAVAFSGGADSSFLAKVVHGVLGDRMTAVTVDTAFVPREEAAAAADLAARFGFRHHVIAADPLSCGDVAANPADRCYHCKLMIFSLIRDFAAGKSIDAVLDGSNYDDTGDYRPGARALAELGVASPLKEAGLTKAEIRSLSREMGVPTWDTPSSSCLAARIPYGDRITREALRAVEAAEAAMRELGFRQVRVRHHGAVARIEVPAADIGRAASEPVRAAIAREMKRCGFAYASLDLEGYRSGSMNETLKGDRKSGQG